MADETTQQEPESTPDAMKPVVKLRFPVNFEGNTIQEIELDLMQLHGQTLSRARQRYESEGKTVLVLGPVSLDFCAYCASEICSLPYEAIAKLIGPDYYKLTGTVRDFLIEADLA